MGIARFVSKKRMRLSPGVLPLVVEQELVDLGWRFAGQVHD